MRYLLDTHILIWWVMKPKALSGALLALLEDPANDLLLSIATPWEMALKTSVGKLNVHRLLHDLQHGNLDRELTILPTEVAHVVRASFLPRHHRDPFDRLLIAQALELRVPIISRDPIFERYGVKRIWSGSGVELQPHHNKE